MAVLAAVTGAQTGRAHPPITWKDVGTDFSDPANWVEGVAPDLNVIPTFDAVAPTHQPTLAAASSAYGLVFASGAGAFTLSGTGPLTIGDSGITNCSTTVTQTISVPLIFTGDGTHWIKNDGKLTISGAVTNSSEGGQLNLAGPGSTGIVSGAISGADDVVKADGGTWTLSGPNLFTGKLRVEGGELTLTGTNTTPRAEVSDGATLNLNAANTLAATTEVYLYGDVETYGTLNVNASQKIATLESGTGGGGGSGALVNIASGATLTIQSPNDNMETYEGTIDGAGSVAKSGSGQQTFSGGNLYTGTTTISGGVLAVTTLANGGTESGIGKSSNAAANLVLDGGTLRYSGASAVSTDRLFTLGAGGGTIDTSGGGAITFSNHGSMAFATANTSATLQLNSGSAVTNTFYPVIGDNGAGVTSLRKNGVGTWVLGSTNTFTGTTDIAYGTLALADSAALRNSTVSVGATGALAFNGITSALLGALSGTKDVALQNDAGSPAAVALTVGGNNASTSYSGILSGAGSLVKNGTGAFTLSGTNTYTGGTTINGGTLVAASDANLGDAAGGLSFNGGTLQAASGFSSARGITLTGGGGTIDTHTYQLTFSGVITGTGKLTHQGTGVLTLSGANNYTGGTVVKGGGVLDFTSNGNLGAGGVELDSGFLRTQGAIANFSHDILLSAGGGNINTVEYSSTISGKLTGAGGLTVQGTGLLALTNSANQYAGATTVSGGTLKIGADNALGALGTGSVSVASGATLDVSGSQTLGGLTGAGAVTIASGKTLTANLSLASLFSGTFSGGGGLTKSGSNTLTLTGETTTLTGPVSVTAGTLRLGDAGTSGGIAADIAVSSGATLEISRMDATPVTFANAVSGAGAISKAGTATLALTNASAFNSFTGTATINGGTLRADADIAAASATVSVTSSGTFAIGSAVTNGVTIGTLTGLGGTTIAAGKKLTIVGTGPMFYSGAISGSGGLERNGTGSLTLNGANSYLGDTWVTAGQIEDGMTGALSSNSTARVKTGATLKVTFNETLAGLDDYATASSGTLSVGNSAVLTIANATANSFTGTLSGAGSLTKSGAGELTFAGTSTYNGAVNVDAGTLTVGATNAFTADSVAVNNAAVFNVAKSTAVGALSGAGTTTVGANETLTIKKPALFGAVVGGAGGLTFANNNSGAGLTTLTASQTYTGTTTVNFGSLQLGNSTAPVSVAGPIVLGSGTKLIFSHGSTNSTHSQGISGGGALEKNNSGTLTLTAGNSYTGSTTVSGGTLKAGAANALPTTTSLSVAAGAALDVAASQTIKSFTNSFATSSIVVEAGQLLNVTLGAGTGFGTGFSGAITGAGGLEIGASGSYVVGLFGANDYHGGTTIDSGAGLLVGDGSTSGMITGDIVNNGRLTFHRSDSVNLTGALSGSGTLTQNGSGQLTLSGAITNASAMTFNGSGVLSVNGLISGSGSLTKSGGGDLYLNAANAYGGGTTVQSGTLFAMGNTATGSGGVAVNGGVLAGSGTVSGPVSVNSGGTVAPGSSLGMPATLSVDAATFAGGGTFAFQIKDAAGSAGSGYSLLSGSGALTIGATSGSPFTISVYSVNGTAQAPAANFDATQGYSWTFATAGSVAGFDAAAFHVNTTNFQNAFTGSFGVSQMGNSLLLNYTPAAVPEPATWALLAIGLGGVFWWRRRGGAGGGGR